MFCKWCGKKIKTNSTACPFCGKEQDSMVNGNGFWDLKEDKIAPVQENTPVKKVEKEEKLIEDKHNENGHTGLLMAIGVLILIVSIVQMVWTNIHLANKLNDLSEKVEVLNNVVEELMIDDTEVIWPEENETVIVDTAETVDISEILHQESETVIVDMVETLDNDEILTEESDAAIVFEESETVG